jgi:hypothetical protein
VLLYSYQRCQHVPVVLCARGMCVHLPRASSCRSWRCCHLLTRLSLARRCAGARPRRVRAADAASAGVVPRRAKPKSLEESWQSLDFFTRHNMGRLAVDAAAMEEEAAADPSRRIDIASTISPSRLPPHQRRVSVSARGVLSHTISLSRCRHRRPCDWRSACRWTFLTWWASATHQRRV